MPKKVNKKRKLNEINITKNDEPKTKKRKTATKKSKKKTAKVNVKIENLLSPIPVHYKIIDSNINVDSGKIKITKVKDPLIDALKIIKDKEFKMKELITVLSSKECLNTKSM